MRKQRCKPKGTLTAQKIPPVSVGAGFGWDGVAGASLGLDGATMFYIHRGCDVSGFFFFSPLFLL